MQGNRTEQKVGEFKNVTNDDFARSSAGETRCAKIKKHIPPPLEKHAYKIKN